jgi:hypothetical protein
VADSPSSAPTHAGVIDAGACRQGFSDLFVREAANIMQLP